MYNNILIAFNLSYINFFNLCKNNINCNIKDNNWEIDTTLHMLMIFDGTEYFSSAFLYFFESVMIDKNKLIQI